jgi:hypothetical protein
MPHIAVRLDAYHRVGSPRPGARREAGAAANIHDQRWLCLLGKLCQQIE